VSSVPGSRALARWISLSEMRGDTVLASPWQDFERVCRMSSPNVRDGGDDFRGHAQIVATLVFYHVAGHVEKERELGFSRYETVCLYEYSTTARENIHVNARSVYWSPFIVNGVLLSE